MNIAQYRNKLIKLNNRQEFVDGDYGARLIPGQAMGVIWGYVCDGIFQNEKEVANHAQQPGAGLGRLKYRDLNGDGIINDQDRCIIGNPNPDLTLGLNIALKYKAFTLDMFFSGEFGYDIVNDMRNQLCLMSSSNAVTNRGEDILNAWTPQNTSTNIPMVTTDDTNNEARISSWNVDNGSYFKMKYIKLSYQLPERVAKAIGGKSIDVFGQVENVFTATKFKGLDPELLPGKFGVRVEDGGWIRPRTFTLGVNLAF